MRREEIALGVLGAGLLGAGIYLALKKPPRVKRVGDTIKAVIEFRGRGPKPADYHIGFGLAPARDAILPGYNDIEAFIYTTVTLDLTPDWKDFKIVVEGKMPSITPGARNKLDCWVFIQEKDKPLRRDAKGYTIGRWYEDVYTLE